MASLREYMNYSRELSLENKELKKQSHISEEEKDKAEAYDFLTGRGDEEDE